MTKRTSIWEFWAPRYEGVPGQRFALAPSRRLFHQHITSAAPHAQRFLDVGCGVGQFVYELASTRPNAEVFGVDPSPGMIKRARSDYSLPNTEYLEGFAEDVKRGDGFDVITSMHSLPYVSDTAKTLSTMAKLLRPGGRLLVVHSNTDGFYDWFFLKFVRLTTSKANYLPTHRVQELMNESGLSPGVTRSISKLFFIPSVNLVEGIKLEEKE